MKILIVAATQFELDSIWNFTQSDEQHQYFFARTGVGMTATAYWLARHLNPDFHDLTINIGLAGAFDKELKLGEVVNVVEDQLSEEGAEDGDGFLSIDDMGLRHPTGTGAENGKIKSTFRLINSNLKKVSGITVNTVHGNEKSIEKIERRLNPQVESMEGAAFLYASEMTGVPSLQIRAISNYVEKRNRDSWEIELALNNLGKEFSSIINKI